ncbi:MAG TPA: acyl-CoA dehydrogenase [Microthrixaceae bacterium]|nr:acyl-CoA dehydrogenase [Microthrixaceae bacterium]
MSIAITDDHVELATTVRRWTSDRKVLAAARAVADGDRGERDDTWAELAALGWIGLAASEANGGSGAGLATLAVVLEELGRACQPGPFLPTVVAATAIDRWAPDPTPSRALIDGTLAGGFGLEPGGPVWGGATADRFVIPIEGSGQARWLIVDRDEVEVVPLPSFDTTRQLATIVLPEGIALDPTRMLSIDAEIVSMATLLASAEAVGVASWCVDTAAEYAANRIQFGRPIGQFQAVKHRCADALVAVEAARALVWDAVLAVDAGDDGAGVAVAAANSWAPAAAFRAAKDCIQVLGGIGYTWEHDAHLFLKRATATHQLLPREAHWRADLVARVRDGEQRELALDLPAEAETVREQVREFVEALVANDKSTWNESIASAGYLVPHWPAPYGLDASPLHQLVIDQEFARARIRRRHLQVAAWVLPTIIAHGTDDQRERWVMPSLMGDLRWCQMFSEPGAGSDLASLSTRAARVEGGWSITGQKVWTTMAREADWAICLARTDPDAPKHRGITCFMLDMSTPGIDIRPLRELTGMAMFNEIFLDDVFVPDDCVVGPVDGGWECARTTLANERVSMSSGSSFGPGVAALFDLADRCGLAEDPLLTDRLGELMATAHAVSMLGVRTTLRALGGAQPGPEASVRKLLGVEHEQLVQEVGLGLLGPQGAVVDGDGAVWTAGFLGNRALSIAGGTSEIQRNVIAERLLGLPKDP